MYRDKALLVPIKDNKILIQDRRCWKPPAFGYFGGKIEDGESPLEAVIRETKEELNLDVSEDEFIGMHEIRSDKDGKKTNSYYFVYPTEQESFEVYEGDQALWMDIEEVRSKLKNFDKDEELLRFIKKQFWGIRLILVWKSLLK